MKDTNKTQSAAERPTHVLIDIELGHDDVQIPKDVARLIRQAADKVLERFLLVTGDSRAIIDRNGNTVGHVKAVKRE